MLKNDFKFALRNLAKNKIFTLINLTGLALSLVCCILLGLYAYAEMTYDQFHPKHDQIFRINKVVTETNKTPEKHSITSGSLAPELLKEVPEIEYAVRLRPWFNEMVVRHENTQQKFSDVVYADADFFQVFGFKLLRGNRKTVLSEPNTAVITEAKAKLFFGNADPLGKTLVVLNETPVTITGVVENAPYNSHLKYDLLVSWGTTTTWPSCSFPG